ncbi:hypothetical protein HanRHA438_Chr10g0449051 [Helianthus annuus]|nr:hypothetical protein HanIR_Chr10g0470961 [Helianthus annuus]KAJ0879235.1 hypothetical protein HanRHA438_Chr10g0449051 [Helianthus annuus]
MAGRRRRLDARRRRHPQGRRPICLPTETSGRRHILRPVVDGSSSRRRRVVQIRSVKFPCFSRSSQTYFPKA